MVIYHPKLRDRILATYERVRTSPRDAATRLRCVFKDDEQALGEFLKEAAAAVRQQLQRGGKH